jgi:protein-tyrosine phosphatase
MHANRVLNWQGCFNARDLGGLPTCNGRRTRWGAVVRSDRLSGLTSDGWSALVRHGIRTIVDLQDEDRRADDVEPRPAGLATLHIPLEDRSDTAFWDVWGASSGLYATPLYYRAFLDRFPERCISVLRAVARAEPGGVVVHCRVGRDRTGLIALLLLALAGARAEDIAEDYILSAHYLPALFAACGEPDEGPIVDTILGRANTTARDAVVGTLAGLAAGDYVRQNGLSEADLASLRGRLLEPELSPDGQQEGDKKG